MAPVPNTPGTYAVDWTAEKPGSYVAEVTAEHGERTELGKDVVDVSARGWRGGELPHRAESRAAGEAVGGDRRAVLDAGELERLPKEISYSEAGISVRDTKELWDMPVVFLVLLGLMSADWLLRRKWGVV